MEKRYSINNEDFVFDSIEEAAEDLWNNFESFKVGDIFAIWEAEIIGGVIKSLAHLQARFVGENGECEEVFPEFKNSLRMT